MPLEGRVIEEPQPITQTPTLADYQALSEFHFVT